MGIFVRSYQSSLANRLTAWYGLSASILLFFTGYFPYWSMQRTLESESANLLFDRLQTVRLVASRDTEGTNRLKERVEKEWSVKKREKIYVRILDDKGKLVGVSPNLDSSEENLFQYISALPANNTKPGSFVENKGVRSYRYLVAEVAGPTGPLTVYVVLDRTDQQKFLRSYKKRLALALCVGFLLSLLIGRRIAVRGMKPIAAIAEQASQIRSSNLHERIDIQKVPVELSQLANTFNEMLTRLEKAFVRLSQFSADIAHELRSPISNMSGEIQVILGKPRPEEEYKDVLGSCLEECGRISQIIDSLLFLARCEDPGHKLNRERVNLKKETEAVLEFYEASIVEAGIQTSLDVPEGFQVEVERTLFQRALGNLLSNALKQTPERGHIVVSAKQEKGAIRLGVEDTGKGIPREHLPHVFDWFYRVDPSRSKDSGGVGLGLAIVKSIAAIHGGKVEIESEVGKGTTVSLWFPSLPSTLSV